MYTNTYPTTSAKAAGVESSKRLLSRLKDLHPQSIDLSLGRMRRLLADLEHPERRLPRVVHVAGTNGKGSLIAYVRAIGVALGKRVQVYTSPHLVDFHERIVLSDRRGGAPITEDRLVECLARAEAANDGKLITLFEITTAAAFLAFAEAPADLLLLETGMGGRLDATNVVDSPLLTVIMPVSIDHVAYLGDTVDAIAAEKAGILKPGVPCVVGCQEPAAMRVIEAKAAVIGSPLIIQGRDFDVTPARESFFFHANSKTVELPLPHLAGRHQVSNAGVAIAAADIVFGSDLTRDTLISGLRTTRWPARLEHLGDGALYDYVADKTEIWLDGGHNPAGGQVIARALADICQRAPRPLHLIWGMMETKDAEAVIAQFKGLVEHVYTVPIPDEPNSFAAANLAHIAEIEGFNATPTGSVPHALLLSQAASRDPQRVLICGSLYLAGHVLTLHTGRSNP